MGVVWAWLGLLWEWLVGVCVCRFLDSWSWFSKSWSLCAVVGIVDAKLKPKCALSFQKPASGGYYCFKNG